jgi:hypothetical protein
MITGVSVGVVVTVDIDITLLHELAELHEPLGGVNLRHVDSAEGRGGVESSSSKRARFGGYMCSSCRVCAPYEAREHGELTFGSYKAPRLRLQLFSHCGQEPPAGSGQAKRVKQPCTHAQPRQVHPSQTFAGSIG